MNDYLKRPMTEEEDKYTFRQSNQISGQTGLIGYLRADFGRDGNEFYSSWEDWNNNLKTPDFKQELDEVINCLREEGDKYAYLLRMNLNKGDYNLYCYCYVKEWLDNHMEKARRGIRFIDSNYNEKFRIADGDNILMRLSNGTTSLRTCRYIDDYHLEVGSYVYHICEFAEHCERNGHTVEPAEKTTAPPKRNKTLER